MTLTDTGLRGVLAIGAHPDDIEFGCGATLTKWARTGSHVEMLVLTDGSKGSWEPDQDLAALVATRREEQREAARTLGALDVHFLDAVDGELEDDAVRREQVCAVIRATRPTWSSVTIRGSSTACTPTTVVRASWRSTGSSPHATPTSSPARAHRTAPRASCSSRRRSSITWKRSTRSTSTPRSKPSSATAANGAPPWASKRVPPLPTSKGRTFEEHIRNEIATTGGEPFKLLTEL